MKEPEVGDILIARYTLLSISPSLIYHYIIKDTEYEIKHKHNESILIYDSRGLARWFNFKSDDPSKLWWHSFKYKEEFTLKEYLLNQIIKNK